MQSMIYASTLLIFIASASFADADTGPLGFGDQGFHEKLLSDRPDFTESVSTIDMGHLQVESGYTYTENNIESSHLFPELLARIGLAENFELRLGWPGYILGTESDGGQTRNFKGTVESSVGFKQRLTTGQKIDFSYIAEIGLPTGRDGIGTENVEPQLKLLWVTDLSEDLSLGGNINLSSVKPEEDRYFESAASLTIGFPLIENLGGYVEYFGYYGWENEYNDTHYINGGVTCEITPDLQLDFRVGSGITSESDDLFSGIGLVFRL